MTDPGTHVLGRGDRRPGPVGAGADLTVAGLAADESPGLRLRLGDELPAVPHAATEREIRTAFQ